MTEIPMFVPVEDLLASLVVVDLDAMVDAAIADKLAEAERKEFVTSIASGTPASEAYLTGRRRRERLV